MSAGPTFTIFDSLVAFRDHVRQDHVFVGGRMQETPLGPAPTRSGPPPTALIHGVFRHMVAFGTALGWPRLQHMPHIVQVGPPNVA